MALPDFALDLSPRSLPLLVVWIANRGCQTVADLSLQSCTYVTNLGPKAVDFAHGDPLKGIRCLTMAYNVLASSPSKPN